MDIRVETYNDRKNLPLKRRAALCLTKKCRLKEGVTKTVRTLTSLSDTRTKNCLSGEEEESSRGRPAPATLLTPTPPTLLEEEEPPFILAPPEDKVLYNKTPAKHRDILRHTCIAKKVWQKRRTAWESRKI